MCSWKMDYNDTDIWGLGRISLGERVMEKEGLLYYKEYEAFYEMAEKSAAFQRFCRDAFGQDFSQDGFSDIGQVDMILPYIPAKGDVHILDIGCGNGKMLGYLQEKTGAFIHGFDYSRAAIAAARASFAERADFQEGIIGGIEYPEHSFDMVISMDTMYFAEDMGAFVAQIRRWLKPDGMLFVGYQEGELVPRTCDGHTTELAKALQKNEMNYEVRNITKQTYELLKTKREAAMVHKAEFEREKHMEWFDMLMMQTMCAEESFEEFEKAMARYIYTAGKNICSD